MNASGYAAAAARSDEAKNGRLVSEWRSRKQGDPLGCALRVLGSRIRAKEQPPARVPVSVAITLGSNLIIFMTSTIGTHQNTLSARLTRVRKCLDLPPITNDS